MEDLTLSTPTSQAATAAVRSSETPDSSRAAQARLDRKRAVTRWNRRLGWALLITFPFSYLAGWISRTWDDGALGSWLSLMNIGAQVVGTIVLGLHAAYTFYVMGFPAPRLNLRAINSWSAYFVLLVYLLSQTSTNQHPEYEIFTVLSFAAIGAHVLISIYLAHQRPDRDEPDLREDARALVDPDADALLHIAEEREQRRPGRDPDRPALECTDLQVSLGQVQVLFGFDLRVQPGETVALLGNNGAGKTTTLRTLAGLQDVHDGTLRIDGFDVTGLTPAGRAELGLNLVSGGRAVFGPLTVDENLRMFGARIEDSMLLDERIARVNELFPWTAQRASQLASTLSGGEQQMLAVAQALVVEPSVLMIDEFSLGLAPKVVGQLIDLVGVINAQGTAVLLVEQSVSVATAVASRVYVMERGRIVLHESAETLRSNPQVLADVYLKGSDAATVAPAGGQGAQR
jgi:branched-chain amino acid transport system ATP-binding protein